PGSSTVPDTIRSLGEVAWASEARTIAAPAAAATSTLRSTIETLVLNIALLNPPSTRKSLRTAHGRQRPRIFRRIAERGGGVAASAGELLGEVRLRERVDAHVLSGLR